MADLVIQKLRNNEYFGLQTTFDNLYNERNKEYQKILSKFEIKAINKLNRLRTEVGNPKLSL